MGEFTGTDDSSPLDDIKADGEKEQKTDDGYPTDVEGVLAHSCIKHGKDEFPCFDVSKNNFFQNMEGGRKRLRFETGSPAQKYMQGSKYSRKFYIKYTDDSGKSMVRPVK
jgi:hypothetical protein